MKTTILQVRAGSFIFKGDGYVAGVPMLPLHANNMRVKPCASEDIEEDRLEMIESMECFAVILV
ncbi:MAG: hypothetical protein WKI04_16035 [Ferruginibacter sp.]